VRNRQVRYWDIGCQAFGWAAFGLLMWAVTRGDVDLWGGLLALAGVARRGVPSTHLDKGGA
jgi:hypothetical protein